MRTQIVSILRRLIPLMLLLQFTACASPVSPSLEKAERVQVTYADGVYRGFYHDGGIEQFCVEFTLCNGLFAQISLNDINYKDGDYLDANATRIQAQVASQYQEAARYLVGKPIDAIADVMDATLVSTDRDAVTSATLRTGKLVSAIRDGLKRGVFLLTDTTVLTLPERMADGVYCGSYLDGARDMVNVRFTLQDSVFAQVALDAPDDTPLHALCDGCAAHLTGKPLRTLCELYTAIPLEGGDAVTEEETGMVVSAFMDALSRGVYEPVSTTVFPSLGDYENGVYRGFYYADGIEQIAVQFELVNDTFVSLRYRALNFSDGDYTAEDASARQKERYRQFLSISDYLTGKPLKSIYALFDPAAIVQDADASSGATLPTNQLVSALMDGLNRGIYRQGEVE